MIACDLCKMWYHCSCVKVDTNEINVVFVISDIFIIDINSNVILTVSAIHCCFDENFASQNANHVIVALSKFCPKY